MELGDVVDLCWQSFPLKALHVLGVSDAMVRAHSVAEGAIYASKTLHSQNIRARQLDNATPMWRSAEASCFRTKEMSSDHPTIRQCHSRVYIILSESVLGPACDCSSAPQDFVYGRPQALSTQLSFTKQRRIQFIYIL